MRVFDINSTELADEFGIETGRWEEYGDLGHMPFGAMWCVVPPGGRSSPDRHRERELVVIVQGSLEVRAASGTRTGQAGSAVLLDGEEEHVLVNRSPHDPLVTLSLYWQPRAHHDGEGSRDGH